MSRIFVTGIGTGIGKTFISAILVEAMQADYWKPIQAGDLENSDTMAVQRLISNRVSVLHHEAYRLTHPLSPHAAADLDGIKISLEQICTSVPQVKDRHLIIEGAGGVMSPINESLVALDLIKALQCETVVVSKHYLGSINHTLLTVDAIRKRGLPLLGIIFNGGEDKSSIDFIMKYSDTKLLGIVDEEKSVDKNAVQKYTAMFKNLLD